MRDKIKYSKFNYRLNLIRYWQQYYPDWEIPKGFHVHHIRPKSLMRKDENVHHPRNLIALHLDDHITIHNLRGDKNIGNFIAVAGVRKGQKVSKESRLKMSRAKKGWKMPAWQKKNLSKKFKGRYVSDQTRNKMANVQTGENSPHFKGYYQTPYGTFSGTTQQDTLPYKTIIDWCKNSDKVITKRIYSHSPYLKTLGEAVIGKTFKSIGFNFIPRD